MIKLIGNPISYIYHYFNLFHCLLVCPYTFVYNSKTGSYKLQTHCLIQVFSFVITLFSFYNPIKKFYTSIFDQVLDVHPMMNLLDLVKAVSECIYVLAISHTFWCRKNDLYGIVNLLQSNEGTFKYSFERRNGKAKVYVALIALIVSATVALNTIQVYGAWDDAGGPGAVDSELQNQQRRLGNEEAVMKVLLTSSQFLSTISPLTTTAAAAANGSEVAEEVGLNLEPFYPQNESDESTAADFTPYKILLLVLYFFEHNFVQLVYCFGDWLMIIISLVLRDAVDRLEQVVQDPTSTAPQVLEYYEALKTLSRRINQVFGFLVFAFTVTSIPLFVTSLLTVMDPKSPAILLRDLIYFYNFFYFLFMAVFIDKKSTILEEWLLVPKNYAQIEQTQLQVLLHEMKTREIGFHGLGLFKVSAGLLGMTINLILTFSIIFLQFNSTYMSTRSGNGTITE